MLVLKNKSTEGVTIYSNELLDLSDNYKLFLFSIGAEGNNENDLFVILYASLVDAMMRDNCYYGLSFLNDMTEFDSYMESVDELFIKPYIYSAIKDRETRNYAKLRMPYIKSFLKDNNWYKKAFLDWIETIGLLLQMRVTHKETMMYPISQEWNNTILTIGYTSNNPAFTKAIIPTPDIYNVFVSTYFNNNYTETLPSNILHNCLDELSNISYGEDVEEIINRILKKALDTIALDQFDPVKSLYYINIDRDQFTQDIYLVILNLLDYLHKLITGSYLHDTNFFVEKIDKRSLTVCFKAH